MQVVNNRVNKNLAFNARFKIKDAHGVLEQSDMDFLRSKAAKIGTKKDFIKVELGDYVYGDTYNFGPLGSRWLTDKEMDSVEVSVKSIFNKKTEKDHFYCTGEYCKDVAEDIVDSLNGIFEKFAKK